MSKVKERKVGERGQVTIPKEIREEEGIKGGDKVKVLDTDNGIMIKKKGGEELKEGYLRMSERDRKISEEMIKATDEAVE